MVLCATGLLSSAAAMVIGFVPSSQFGNGSVRVCIAIVGGGLLLLLGVIIPYLFLRLRKPGRRLPEGTADERGRRVSTGTNFAPEPTGPEPDHGDGDGTAPDPPNGHGAAGPGQRPVLSDRQVVLGEAVVLSAYCPDKPASIKDKIADLDLRDTVRD